MVLATSIAESSLTIEGVRAVVDSGLSRVPVQDAASSLTSLVTVPASLASADQRRGRAGALHTQHILAAHSQSESLSILTVFDEAHEALILSLPFCWHNNAELSVNQLQPLSMPMSRCCILWVGIGYDCQRLIKPLKASATQCESHVSHRKHPWQAFDGDLP